MTAKRAARNLSSSQKANAPTNKKIGSGFKANAALAVSIAGSFLTFKASGNGFFPGLIYHGFIASAIGGLAEWFAVTALFRRQLGIKFRTEILRRNRARIQNSIVTFAADDLLSTDNIMSVVNTQDTAALMTDYLVNRGGRERVKELVTEILFGALSVVDTKKIAAALAPSIRVGFGALPIISLLHDACQIITDAKYSRPLILSLIGATKEIYRADEVQKIILTHITALRRDYESDSMGRAFVLSSLGLDDEKILSLLNEKVIALLDGLAEPGNEYFGALQKNFVELMQRLADNHELLANARGYVMKETDNIDVAAYIDSELKEHFAGNPDTFWLKDLYRFIDGEIDDFAASEERRQTFDCAVKNFIAGELNKHHDVAEKMIAERFNKWSDDELTEFVETRVADDLQMIRINGAVVGAMVGMGLYIIVWLTERIFLS